MYLVKDFLENHQKKLFLQIVAGHEGLKRVIRFPEVDKPGLTLAGYLKKFTPGRLLVFGEVEIHYLKDLDLSIRQQRLKAILKMNFPAIILAGNFLIPKELISFCDLEKIPLLRTSLSEMDLILKTMNVLEEEFSDSITCHGTFIELFGVGVLIQGDSSIGKSEAALGLIEKGHRLISDDIVRLKLRKDSYLEGSGPELTQHMMEIRGIGMINVAHLYGAICVRVCKQLDIVVKLEEWNDNSFYDRIGLDEKYCNFLGLNVPFHLLPVKPGRDVVLLIETIVRNYLLKQMGYHSAKEFNVKLLETIAKKQSRQKRKRRSENFTKS